MTKLVDSFAAWAQGRPGLEPDIVATIVDLKANYLDDPNPGRWRSGDLSQVLLELIPRKVSADDEWFAAAVPTARSFITFAASKGALHRGSAPVQELLRELNDIDAEFGQAIHDPARFGMAKSIFSRMGADPEGLSDDPAELRAVMDRFNALPFEERKAVTEPSFAASGLDPDAGAEPRVLPSVRLAPVSELAAAVRAAPALRDVDQLVAWLGNGRAVTATGVLTLKETKDVVRSLGWQDDDEPPGRAVRSARDLPRLNLAWELAQGAGVVEVTSTKARPGPERDALAALHAPGPEADQRLIALWQQLFEAALNWVATPEDRFGDADDSAGMTVVHALLSDYSGDAHTIRDLAEEVHADDADDCDDDDPEDVAAHESLMRVFLLVSIHELLRLLGPFVALGAVREVTDDEDLVVLTPLGVAGVRQFAVGQGFEAPIAGDVAGLSAEQALDQIMSASENLSEVLAQEWFAARSQVDAVAQMLDVARSGSANLRYAVLALLDDVLEDGIPSLAPALAHEPLLGLAIRALLAERRAMEAVMREPVSGPGPAPSLDDFFDRMSADPAALVRLHQAVSGFGWLEGDFTPAERDLLVVEAFARVLPEIEPPVCTADLDECFWAQVDDDAVPRLAATGHPEVLVVMEALGTGHSAGRVRKAVKKAAHKLRLSVVP